MGREVILETSCVAELELEAAAGKVGPARAFLEEHSLRPVNAT
jgi:hypothetical protein